MTGPAARDGLSDAGASFRWISFSEFEWTTSSMCCGRCCASDAGHAPPHQSDPVYVQELTPVRVHQLLPQGTH